MIICNPYKRQSNEHAQENSAGSRYCLIKGQRVNGDGAKMLMPSANETTAPNSNARGRSAAREVALRDGFSSILRPQRTPDARYVTVLAAKQNMTSKRRALLRAGTARDAASTGPRPANARPLCVL
ncbi:hypothetical protein EVAR_60997_1 [Eumeta japonica]|uniref:Uncharacterized protein n=1 Tax=Eumeta variegata TaxID=151549 RepID=A0A4C1ZST3_EUMVA|nr:hypothetical protein EVAR_60997_1 [Eumeta japonica]